MSPVNGRTRASRWTARGARATIAGEDPMGWIAYVAGWIAAALFWALAAASAGGMSPLETLPWGLLAMGTAALMGVGVWRLTARVAWDWRSTRFYRVHAVMLALFSLAYANSWMLPDLIAGRWAQALDGLRTSPVLIWNLLMGSWLYLMIAGLSYAVRAHRRLRAQEAAAAEARVLAQQAQLAALRAQINPHFLFNALHSVSALVATDPERADKALESLGNLLRYALGTEEQVLFSQEWQFVQDYLAFEQLRLGDQLVVEAVHDPAAMAVMVPPLSLQPIVENAVRHGIADRPEGGRVSVHARVGNDRLVLRVADDGRGRPAGAMEGIGLSSVRRRLAASFGEHATLALDTTPSGCVATISLPLTPRGAMGSAA